MSRGCFFACATALCLLSVLAGPRDGHAGWEQVGMAQGLPSDTAAFALQDSQDRYWFTTPRGLTRYDGTTWHTFGSEVLGSTQVRDVFEYDDRIWALTADGIVAYDDTTWQYWSISEGVPSATRRFFFGPADSLWIMADSSVARYDGVSWELLRVPDRVLDVLVDPDGILWVGGSRDVFYLDAGAWATLPRPRSTYQARDIHQDRRGIFWVAGNWGVWGYDRTNSRWLPPARQSISQSLLEDRFGRVWVGGEHDPFFVRDSTWGSMPSEVAADGFRYHEDNEGIIWVRSDAGLLRYDSVNPAVLQPEPGFPPQVSFRSMGSDRSGNLWVTMTDRLWRFDGPGPLWSRVTAPLPPENTSGASAIMIDSTTVWLATGYRTWTYADGVVTRVDYLTDSLDVDARAMHRATNGDLWFGGGRGLARFDGAWTSFSFVLDGLGSSLLSFGEDTSGRVIAGTTLGALVWDGGGWSTLTADTAVAGKYVGSVFGDRGGAIWMAVGDYSGMHSVCRFDGIRCTRYDRSNGMPENVVAILQHPDGDVWFVGGSGGLARWHDGMLETVNTVVPCAEVAAAVIDHNGDLWAGGDDGCEGVVRYDGIGWGRFTSADGLEGNRVTALATDDARQIWMGLAIPARFVDRWGLTLHNPDYVRPQAAVVPALPPVVGSRSLVVGLGTAFREPRFVEYCHELDRDLDLSNCNWTSATTATLGPLDDGIHTLHASARDAGFNVDSSPTRVTFEVDATPPTPVLTQPASGNAVKDVVTIVGSADDARSAGYTLEVSQSGGTWATVGAGAGGVEDDTLATWDTITLADGDYDIRLTEADTLGLTGATIVRVVVDNVAPFAAETTPVLIRAADGGDVYTTNREAHLYVPPRAFRNDAVVELRPPTSPAPCNAAAGAQRIVSGYVVQLDQPLEKPVTLELAYADSLGTASPSSLAVYRCDGSSWTRLGGSVENSNRIIALNTAQPGWYAVFADGGTPGAGPLLSEISLVPPVFSPSGTYASSNVTIGFTLLRAAPVTVRVYNRAGRLVRRIADGQTMGPGASVVQWNGTNRSGGSASEGLYLVTVEALGEKRIAKVAIVR